MTRSIAAALAALMLSATNVRAAEPAGKDPVAPTPAVAAAWARESKPSSAVRTLYATYGVVQGLDMVTTIAARNRGAAEANPIMQGSYGHGIAIKAAMGAATSAAVRAIEKKNKKAAIVTMVAMNVATAAVVANNMRNAQRAR